MTDEVKQYLSNQKTSTGEKLELPQELLNIASQAEKDGVSDDEENGEDIKSENKD